MNTVSPVAHLHDIVAEFGVTVAIGIGEAVVVDFRLIVVVRRIARPAAGIIDDFAEHEIGFRPGGAVEDQPDIAQAGVLDQPGAAVFRNDLFGEEKAGREVAVIGSSDHGEFCAGAQCR